MQLPLTAVNRLRIKPSAGTVRPLHADEVRAIEYPRSSDQSSEWKLDPAIRKGKQLSTQKLDVLNRTRKLEQLIKSNSEKKGGRAMYGIKFSQGWSSNSKTRFYSYSRLSNLAEETSEYFYSFAYLKLKINIHIL